MLLTEKRCHVCKEIKPISAFSEHAGRPDGHRADCRLCASQAVKSWRSRNTERRKQYARKYSQENAAAIRVYMRRAQFKRHYGITVEQHAAMWAEQHGLCKLCGDPMIDKGTKAESAVVDHCHKTKVIRGLIHSKCNCLLGFAADSVAVLTKAIRYLEVAPCRA